MNTACGKSLECVSGHNYAVAKEGHVNLLRSGRKAKQSGTAGDENGYATKVTSGVSHCHVLSKSSKPCGF